jgi:hypothetical protein
MINMFKVLKTMAIRAKYFKIRNFVIHAISIYMMNTKNTWFRIVAASIAHDNHIASEHLFSDRGKFRAPFRSGSFAITLLRAEFSFMARMAGKFLVAMLACIYGLAFVSLRNVVARSRAVFCFIAPRRNMCKCIVAY